jgi:hypothetical protein
MIMIACCQLEFSILDHRCFGVRVVAGVGGGGTTYCYELSI